MKWPPAGGHFMAERINALLAQRIHLRDAGLLLVIHLYFLRLLPCSLFLILFRCILQFFCHILSDILSGKNKAPIA